MKRLAVVLLLLAVLGLTARSAPRGSTHSIGASLTDAARHFAAIEHGISPDALVLAHRASTIDPLSGRPATALKLLDTRTGVTYGVVLDKNGPLFGTARLPPRVRAAMTARRRRLNTLTVERLARSGDEATPVVLWLQESGFRTAARPSARTPAEFLNSPEQADAIASGFDKQRSRAVATIVAPVLERLQRLGRAARAHTYAPALSLELSAQAIREVASWPEVDRIYLDSIAEPEMEIARSSMGASIVQKRGFSGTGRKIAMIEVGGRAAVNPWLEVSQDETFACQLDHTTGVAGLINSVHPTVRGVAPGALLWVGGSCGGRTTELQDRAEAAADWGARAINLSWGTYIGLTPGASDRFFDEMVLNRHLVVVKSAGNRGGICKGDGFLTSPALAYNLITVGGYDDRNTVSWTDDVMDECSSYVNPYSINGDREKPEIVAPSMNVNSTVAVTDSAPSGVGNIGSGTSWSAGLITGAAGLLFQRAPALEFWPEAVKAILMATAVHNVEGARELSDRDGAGAVSLDRADDVARRFRGDWDGMPYECSLSAPGPTVAISASLVAGRRTRAVIAWNNDPAYEFYDEQPGADLDLVVLDPLGVVVAHAASLDNTFELIDFIPAVTGDYTLRVTAPRCEMSPRYLGWAWWRAG